MPAEPADFGARLRRAREARGLSLREVAAATKISALVLEALERNDVSRLPGGLFSRAFVRAYAREVGLDPEQTVRDFAERFSDGDETARTDEGVRVRSSSTDLDEAAGRSGLGWLGLAVTLLLVIVWIGVNRYYGSRGQPATPSPATSRPAAPPVPPKPSAPSESQAAAGNVAAGSPPAQPPAPAPPAATVPQALSPPAADAPQVPNPSDAPAQAQPTPGGQPAAPAAAPVAVDPSLPLQVVLSPVAPCWISAKVDGNRIVGRTVQAGEKLHLSAAKSIVLSAGDAAALSYTVNSSPGRTLGKAGEVVTVVITTNNYRTFMASGQ